MTLPEIIFASATMASAAAHLFGTERACGVSWIVRFGDQREILASFARRSPPGARASTVQAVDFHELGPSHFASAVASGVLLLSRRAMARPVGRPQRARGQERLSHCGAQPPRPSKARHVRTAAFPSAFIMRTVQAEGALCWRRRGVVHGRVLAGGGRDLPAGTDERPKQQALSRQV